MILKSYYQAGVWWIDDTGNVMLDVRYGNRRTELKPGKPTIEVGSAANLLPTLQAVREAAAAGELDRLSMAATKFRIDKRHIFSRSAGRDLSKKGDEAGSSILDSGWYFLPLIADDHMPEISIQKPLNSFDL